MSSKNFNSSIRGVALSISRKVFPHGNSLALTIPWTFAKALKLKPGQQVYFQITKAGNVVISDKPLHTIGSFTKRVTEAVEFANRHQL